MGKRSQKKRRRDRVIDSPPTASSPERSSRGRFRRGIFLLIGLVVIGVAAAFVVYAFKDSLDSKVPAATTSERGPLRVQELPSLSFTPPNKLSVPNDLPESQRDQAVAARDAYRQAVDAHNRDDRASFVGLARKALSSFRQANWLPNELAAFHIVYISLLVEGGQVAQALREGESWLSRYPQSIHHRDTLGELYYRQGQLEFAAGYFEVVAKSYPNSLATQRRLARAYSFLGAQEKARVAVDRCLRLIHFQPGRYPKHRATAETLSVCLQVSHRFYDYHRLAEIAAVIVANNPKHQDALMALGVAERHLGRYDAAVEHLREYLKLASQSSTNLQAIEFDLGVALMKGNRYREAAEVFVTLLTRQPYTSKAYLHLGRALARLGQPERAQGFLEWTRTLAPIDLEVRKEAEYRGARQTARADRSLAHSHRLRGDYAAAERVLRAALRSGDVGHRLYYLEQLEETARAVEALRQVEELGKEIGGNQHVVRGWKAAALALKGDVAQAADLFEKAAQGGDEALRVWGPRLVRLSLDELRDASRARRWVEAVLELGPEPGLEILLARSHFDAGEIEEAWKILDAMSTGTPGWLREHGALWLAYARARLGRDLEKAGHDLETLASSASHMPTYHLARAEWLEAGGGESSKEDAQSIQKVRARAAELRTLQETFRATHKKAAGTATESAKAALLVHAARILYQMGDRKGALREARLAVFAAAEETAALEVLESWLDRPNEIFVRTKVQRELRALDASRRQAPSVEELLKLLLEPEKAKES